MVGTFGLLGDGNPYHFPGDRLVERASRVDIWMLSRCGGLAPGVVTELEIETVGGARPVRTVNVCREGHGVTIDGVLVRLTWDEAFGVERPWFLCPSCGQRCRHLYLRVSIACRRCHRLDYAVRHINRQVPGAARVERLRRKLGDCEVKPFAPLPARIRNGRSRARHDGLVRQIQAEEARLVAHLGSIVYDLNRRLRGRRGKKRHDPTKTTPRAGSVQT